MYKLSDYLTCVATCVETDGLVFCFGDNVLDCIADSCIT